MAKVFSRNAPDTGSKTASWLPELVMLSAVAVVAIILGWRMLHTSDSDIKFPIGPAPKANHLRIEIARSPEDRRIGLSKYQNIEYDQGMAFEFETAGQQCVWNKNVSFPVSVAFIGGDGKIMNIEDMLAHSVHLACSAGPTKYAIETRTDWMNDHWRKPKGK